MTTFQSQTLPSIVPSLGDEDMDMKASGTEVESVEPPGLSVPSSSPIRVDESSIARPSTARSSGVSATVSVAMLSCAAALRCRS